MAVYRNLEPRIRVQLTRIEVVIARLRVYASRFKELENRALARARNSEGTLRVIYQREAENARLSREILEHIASRLEALFKILSERGIEGPTVRLMLEDVINEISRIRIGSLSSGGPAILATEAEAALQELRRIGGA